MNSSQTVNLLYLIEATKGGISEYAVYQIKALEKQGIKITVLCRPEFPVGRLSCFKVFPVLPARPAGKGIFRRLIDYVIDSRRIGRRLLERHNSLGFDYILIDCFREYLAPFWAEYFRKTRRTGVRIGVMTHDPIRDFVVGPMWWHEFSIRQAYSFIDDVFVHDDRRIDFGGVKPDHIQIHTLPHGPYTYPPETLGRDAMRRKYNFRSNDLVFLSFGQIRDGKNLDSFIRILSKADERIKLFVAGKGGAQSQKPPEYYQSLARDLGVEDRCTWEIRYIPDEEVADFFEMSDVVLLTYSKAFVSASGVLNSAVQFGKPVLASGGEGKLKLDMINYEIGHWIEPDDDLALLEAVDIVLEEKTNYSNAAYLMEHTWEQNAAVIIENIDP